MNKEILIYLHYSVIYASVPTSQFKLLYKVFNTKICYLFFNMMDSLVSLLIPLSTQL